MSKLSSALILGVSMLATAHPVFAENFTMWARDTTAPWLPEHVAAYNRSHENKVDLQIIPNNDLLQKFATAVAGGNAPDALSLDLIFTPALVSAGQVADLTSLIDGLPYKKALVQSHMSLGTYEDRNYALPFYVDGSILYWNKDLFAQAGLDPEKGPSTWAEVREAAKKVRALGGDTYGYWFSGACGGCNIFTFAPYIWAADGNILSPDGSKVTIDTPQMERAVDFYRDMIADGSVPPSAQTDNGSNFVAAFTSGKVGIAAMGAYSMGALLKQNSKINFGVSLIPGENGGVSSFLGGDNFVVTAGHEDKIPLIKEFLEWTFDLPQQKSLAAYGNLPVRTDIANDALAGFDARYQVAAKAAAVGKTPYSLVFNDLINSATSPWSKLITDAIYGNDPKGALQQAQASMQQIIDDAN